MVVVEHDNGVESIYAHNSKNLVKSGQRVSGRLPIAKVGSTGRSTGPHLHFEVHRDGQVVDPKPYLYGESIQVAQAT
jgi:murein DD-endopeptidase MepM/ murein hydrolase activator NlpD